MRQVADSGAIPMCDGAFVASCFTQGSVSAVSRCGYSSVGGMSPLGDNGRAQAA